MTPQELAAQLRCPTGADAAAVGEQMSVANGGVICRGISALALRAGDAVLEIGPGDAAFAGDITGAADGIRYTGLDWSADMVAAARARNPALLATGQAEFLQGSSEAMPLLDAAFDKVLSVNTIYFWEAPVRHLAEVARVLKPQGRFCLVFGDAGFMSGLPFTSWGFSLHDAGSAEALLAQAGLRVVARDIHREQGVSNSGAVVDKQLHVLVCAHA